MRKPNPALADYVQKNILPRYAKCDAGHNQNHVNYVIRRSLEFAERSGEDLDPDVVYVAAAYHDLGCLEDRKRHNEISARMLMADGHLDKFLTPEQKVLAAEAAEDHRNSLGRPPRSVYGKLVASADRDTSVTNMLYRVYNYRAVRGMSGDELVRNAYEFVKERFGPGSGAKDGSYFPDPELDDMLAETARLLQDPDKFRTRLMKASRMTPEQVQADLLKNRRNKAASWWKDLTGGVENPEGPDRDPTGS